ncbi:MAG: hypothetical protein Q9M28_09145 [Mariprofundaceae bacterium]|nr:hypothetical protein [Mariprofundaceae bacterium]
MKIFMLMLVLLCGSASVQAQTWQALLPELFAKHADLKVASWQARYANNAREQMLAVYDTQFQASMGISHETTVAASAFSASTTDAMQVMSQGSRLLSNGDQLSVNMVLNRRTQDVLFNQFDPAYSSQLNFKYRHPLLRGANNQALKQNLQASQLDETLVRWQLAMIRQALAGQLLGLAYQQRQIHIKVKLAHAAVQRSQRLLSYQRKREVFGLIESSERLQTAALLRLRQREEAQAKADLFLVEGKVNRLLQRPLDQALLFTWPDKGMTEIPSLSQSTQLALRQRPVFQMDNIRLDALEARSLAVAESEKIQLDVITELGTRALSSSPLHSALSIADPRKHYVYVGLEFSDSVQKTAAHAQLRQLSLQQHEVHLLRVQRVQQLKDQLADVLLQIKAAKLIHASMQASEKAEKRKFYAESERYRQGRSTTAVLIQFEDSLRQAQLVSSLQHIQRQFLASQLQWLQGSLMASYEQGLRP